MRRVWPMTGRQTELWRRQMRRREEEWRRNVQRMDSWREERMTERHEEDDDRVRGGLERASRSSA